jgi:hypothetical protein
MFFLQHFEFSMPGRDLDHGSLPFPSPKQPFMTEIDDASGLDRCTRAMVVGQVVVAYLSLAGRKRVQQFSRLAGEALRTALSSHGRHVKCKCCDDEKILRV